MAARLELEFTVWTLPSFTHRFWDRACLKAFPEVDIDTGRLLVKYRVIDRVESCGKGLSLPHSSHANPWLAYWHENAVPLRTKSSNQEYVTYERRLVQALLCTRWGSARMVDWSEVSKALLPVDNKQPPQPVFARMLKSFEESISMGLEESQKLTFECPHNYWHGRALFKTQGGPRWIGFRSTMRAILLKPFMALGSSTDCPQLAWL